MAEFLKVTLEIGDDVVKLFEDASVDREMLMGLTEKDLEKMGVTNFLTRRKIIKRRDRMIGRRQKKQSTETWRYAIARCLIFIVIFFSLHTAVNKYVLKPYFQHQRGMRTPMKHLEF